MGMKTGTHGTQTTISLQHAEQMIPVMQEQMTKDILLEMEHRGLEPLSPPKTRVEDAFWTDDETGKTFHVKHLFCWCDYKLEVTNGRTEG